MAVLDLGRKLAILGEAAKHDACCAHCVNREDLPDRLQPGRLELF